jgi:hypothetical protein
MIFRLRLFTIHLAASSMVLLLLLGAIYLGWYAWPAWYLEGSERIVGLVVLVDLLLGPLATLLVSNPRKARHLLRMNLTVIILIQLAALSYGTWTLWQARPLYYAFSVNQIELVTAAQFDEESLKIAHQKSATIIPSWSSLPQWIWAPLPDDPKEAETIVLSAITTGEDVTGMPQHFFPWTEGLGDLRRQLQPMPELRENLKLDEAAYTALINSFGKDEAKVGWILIQGGKREGVMMFERETGEYLRFLPMPSK